MSKIGEVKLKGILEVIFNDGYKRGLPQEKGTEFTALNWDNYVQAICDLDKEHELPLLTDEELLLAFNGAVSIQDIAKHTHYEDCVEDKKKQVRAVAKLVQDADLKALKPQPVELPLLTDEQIIDAVKSIQSPIDWHWQEVLQLVAKAQRDADQKAIGKPEQDNAYEKPTEGG